MIKVYKRNDDNTLSFYKELRNGGSLANAKKEALKMIEA
jgi:hypothetical protein